MKRELLRTAVAALDVEVVALSRMIGLLGDVLPHTSAVRAVFHDARILAWGLDAAAPPGEGASLLVPMDQVSRGKLAMSDGLSQLLERLEACGESPDERRLAAAGEEASRGWSRVCDGLVAIAPLFDALTDETKAAITYGARRWSHAALETPDTPTTTELILLRQERYLHLAMMAERSERAERHRLITEALAGHTPTPAPSTPIVYRPQDNTTPGRVDHFNNPHAPAVNSEVAAGVGMVVSDRDEILLIRRTDTGRWALPGGAVDPGESAADATVREVWEETGVHCELITLQGVYTDPGHRIEYLSDGEVRSENSTVYVARPVGGEPTPSSETSEVEWVAADEALRRPMTLSMFVRVVHFVAGVTEYRTPAVPSPGD